ncbi:MAG: methyltransferase, partial [Mesorhizobium sp.]|uniref:trimethylamine methyltransferase family protein n=1 Tax=Mesorhizobium sp. TaxID=1871066 RepID=UPI001224EF68
MSEPRRKRGAERTSNRGPAAIPQLPLRRVENPYPPMALLSADQIEAIHQASMHLLENFGVEVMSPRALSLFERAGAKVDHGSMNVRVDRGMVEEALRSTRSSYTLTPRNPARAIHLGGSTINFTLVAGPPNVHDMERGRRAPC